MFPLRLPIRRTAAHRSPARALAGSGSGSTAAAIARLGLLVLPLAAGLPSGASAQTLGTMQVTARVLPGRPSWTGLAEARTMIQSIDLTARGGSVVRRSGLVESRARIAVTGGRRGLLVTVDYPRN